jgi:hypothetical protein
VFRHNMGMNINLWKILLLHINAISVVGCKVKSLFRASKLAKT